MFVLVAVRALRERKRLFEIAASVAGTASHRLMLADQRILGLGVIEILGESRRNDTLPTGGAMTRLTRLLSEDAFMRVSVAVIALRERKSHVARLLVGSGSMALRARNLRVLPG